MITEEHLEAALNFMKTSAAAYGAAKASRIYLQEFRKSLKARLYNNAPGTTVADRENWAYAHKEYVENLEGIRVAVAEEEELRWKLTAAQVQCELYRTQQASARAMDRSAA